MSTKITKLANELVRDIAVGFFQRIGGPRLMSDEHVTALRVLVGMKIRHAALIGAQYGARRVAPKPARDPKPPLPAPPATTEKPFVIDDATTEKMPRR